MIILDRINNGAGKNLSRKGHICMPPARDWEQHAKPNPLVYSGLIVSSFSSRKLLAPKLNDMHVELSPLWIGRGEPMCDRPRNDWVST